MIKRIVGLCYERLLHGIKDVIITVALIVVRLYHCWRRTSGVDRLANPAVDTFNYCGLNLWWGRTKIRVETTKFICVHIVTCMIISLSIAVKLWSTSVNMLWRDPILTCYPGRQTVVDGHHCEGNESQVEFIN
jgi:hypothetical protein